MRPASNSPPAAVIASPASRRFETSLSGSCSRKTTMPFSAAVWTKRRTKSPPTGREPTRKRPRNAIPSGVSVRPLMARIRSHGLSTPRLTALSKTPPPETSSDAKPARSRISARSRIAEVGSRPASGSWLTSRTVVSTSAGIGRTLTSGPLGGGKLSERVQHEVHDGKERGERDRHPKRARVRERIGQPGPDVREERLGPDDEIPAVPAQRPSQVDPERAREETRADEPPAPQGAAGTSDDHLHQVDGEEPEEGAGPGEGAEEHQVEPERRVASRSQVDEVGQEVRRVREEEQPERAERQESPQPDAAMLHVVDPDRRDERDPGEEEVPREEPVGTRIGIHPSGDEQRPAEHGGKRQRGERQRPAITHRAHDVSVEVAYAREM